MSQTEIDKLARKLGEAFRDTHEGVDFWRWFLTDQYNKRTGENIVIIVARLKDVSDKSEQHDKAIKATFKPAKPKDKTCPTCHRPL